METAQVKETKGLTTPAEQPAFQPPKKKRKWVKWLVGILVLLALIFMVFIRPLLGAGQELLSAVYMTQTADIRDMTVTVSSTGTVTPIDSYKVSALVTGEVLEAPFEEGDVVEKGAVLYRIEATDAQTAVAQAELALRQAQLNYDNTIQYQQPSAGVSGVVQQLYVRQGDMVAAGSPIADLSDTTRMELAVQFHALDAQQLAVGQQVTVTVEGTMETIPGTIQSIGDADQVGAGGTLLRQVKVQVHNPGALTESTQGTVSAGLLDCAVGGSFQSASRQTVVAMTNGEVSELLVSAGTYVTAGTPLVSLGGSAAKATLENADIALENAKLTLQRAVDGMDHYTITAPISGTVIEKNFKTGDTIDSASLTAAGGNLAILFDMSALTFEMSIDELDINKIGVGQEVSITADAVEGAEFQGLVDKVSINGRTMSGRTTYPITVEITEPGLLKPGMNVSADVIIERVGEVLCVPVDAVNRGAQSPYVMVAPAAALDANGHVTDFTKLERREVTLGRNDESYIEILGGLEQGEVVAWENQSTNPFAYIMSGTM